MTNMRKFAVAIAAGSVVILSGCVAPGGVYSDGGYGSGYDQPYYGYGEPAVAPPTVVLGVDSYYGRPGYYGGPRPGYWQRPGYGPHPGYGPRPGYVPRAGYGAGPRPPVVRPGVLPAPVLPQPQARGTGPAPGYRGTPPPQSAPGVRFYPSWKGNEPN